MKIRKGSENGDETNPDIDTSSGAQEVQGNSSELEAFGAIADSIHSTIFIHQGGKVVYCNSYGERDTGYSLEEIMQMNFWDILREDYKQVIKQRGVSRLDGDEVPENYEVPIIRKDGEERWLQISVGTVLIDGIRSAIISSFDVTDRRKMEQYQRESEEKYRAVMEQSPNNIYLVDIETMDIIESNTSLQDFLGYSQEELRKMKPYDFIDHFPEDINSKVEGLTRKGSGFVGERKYKCKDGTVKDVEVSGNVINYGGKKALCIVSWDITDRKNSENEIRKLNEVLRLIGRMTRHDIRNRLAIAYGILELKVKGHELDDEIIKAAYKAVKKSIDITKRMNELESLLMDDRGYQSYDLKDVVEKILVDYPIRYHIKGNCEVLADRALESVIENIVGNSIQHGKADRMDVKIESGKDHCRLIMADNGEGIADSIKTKIFNESFSVGENRGTGLGLFIVKKIVERYGGKVEVRDTYPKGATFILTFQCKKSVDRTVDMGVPSEASAERL